MHVYTWRNWNRKCEYVDLDIDDEAEAAGICYRTLANGLGECSCKGRLLKIDGRRMDIL